MCLTGNGPLVQAPSERACAWCGRAELPPGVPTPWQREGQSIPGARGSFPTIPGAQHPYGRANASAPLLGKRAGAGGDKEPFEGVGDVSQGLAVPLCRGARAGASCPPQSMALSFIFCLCSVWSSSAGSKARRLAFLPAEAATPCCSGSRPPLAAPWAPVCPPMGGAGLCGHLCSAAGVLRGSPPCVCLAGARAFSLPWLGEGERVASPDLLAQPNIRAWLPLRPSTCNSFLPSQKRLSGNEGEERGAFHSSLPPERLGIGGSANPPTWVPPHRPLGCSRMMPTTWGQTPHFCHCSFRDPPGNGGLGKKGLQSRIAGIYRVEHSPPPPRDNGRGVPLGIVLQGKCLGTALPFC